MAAAVILDGAVDLSTHRMSYRDPRSGYEVVVTAPSVDPQLWREYLAGAVRSYRAHDVEHALDYDQMQDGTSSSLVFVVLAPDGQVSGGIRAQGPYRNAEECHAVGEWEGHPGQDRVRAAVERWLPDGAVEMKSAWVALDVPGRLSLFACLCRTPIHAATLLGARYAMGTAAAHVLSGWVRAGAAITAEVPPAPYPDERFRTNLACFDLKALAPSMTARERRATADEAAQLLAPTVPTQGSR